jgi:hypothetical protein
MPVRYHGSLTQWHGTYRIVGFCDCDACDQEWDAVWDQVYYSAAPRYRDKIGPLPLRHHYHLTDDHGNTIEHARGASVTPVTRPDMELGPPADDAEFLVMCAELRNGLHALNGQVGAWLEALYEIGLPDQVITHIRQAVTQVHQATLDITRLVNAFQDQFEDVRTAAARGLTITGHDST